MTILLHPPKPPQTLMSQFKRCLAGTLALAIVMSHGLGYAQSVNTSSSDAIKIRGGISVGAKGDEVIPSLSLRDADIRDVLYTLSEQAGFNLIVDSSVTGTISLDLTNISINKVMEYVMTLANLTYYKDGKTVIISSTDAADKQSLNKLVLKSIPVRYSNASDLSEVLNSTIFSINRPGGNSKAIATADARTNSILIMGNEQDIDLANRALGELDFPLQHKTFFLKNAPAIDVANTISQTLFSVRLTLMGGSASGGSSVGSESSNTAASSSPTGSAVQVLKGGPVTFIANTVNNTLTLIGTAQQIELAEAMLYDVDIKPAQVAIQMSVLQLNENRVKNFKPGYNNVAPGAETPNNSGQGTITLNNGRGGLTFNGALSTFFWGSSNLQAVRSALLSQYAFEAFLLQTKGKLLANPTIMAVSGTTSKIDVTRDVFSGTKTVVSTVGGTGTTVSEPIIKQAGVSLSITPEVAPDGTVSLAIQPAISSPNAGTATTANGETITLTSTETLDVAKVRIMDGQTLVLGGLIQENASSSYSKVPFLGDIPILGSLLRPSQATTNDRSELIIVVTPHIIKEDGVPYFRKEWQNSLSYGQPASTNQADSTVVPASSKASEGNAAKGIHNLVNQPSAARPRQSVAPQLNTFSEVLK